MKISNARLDWREDDLPYSAQFEDVYYSRDDAAGESQHVFIAANRLQERFAQLAAGATFVIGEMGFGSGLNFLQTLALWRRAAPATARLHYLGFEQYPLTRADIARLHRHWPQLAAPSATLLRDYPDHTGGCHRLPLAADVILDLHYGDAGERLQALAERAAGAVDCWFLDGFTPARNPALWEASLFRLLAANSRHGATLSSYSVAGQVRAALAEAGFTVQKQPGFGRKRHMLLASWPGPDAAARELTGRNPWLHPPPPVSGPRHVLVIGAGLAGCSTAYALALRGWRVTVFDAGAGPAAGASGIPQMALRCRLFRTGSAQAEFFLHAFLFAARQFPSLLPATGWHGDGVLQLEPALNRAGAFSSAELQALYASAIVGEVGRDEASALAGVALQHGGLYLPLGGWLQPAELCRRYLAHPAIAFRPDTDIGRIVPDATCEDGGWSVRDAQDARSLASAPVVVIANSSAAARFEQSGYLPLRRVRGQVTGLPATTASAGLARVVNGERTVFPASLGHHTLAASYSESKLSPHPDADDDALNCALAAANFSSPHLLAAAAATHQVAFRCNSADRIPVVGALANAAETRTRLAALARNAKSDIRLERAAAEALYFPGLYVSVAHGSNGLASCPLSGEILASLISGEIAPCPGAVLDELNPMRFLVRQLKRQRAS